MYFLGVLCLLSAAVALPTPDQLHTNLPAPPPPPELKSNEADIKSEEKIIDLPEPQHEPDHEPEHAPAHELEHEPEHELLHEPEHESEHESEHVPEHEPEHELDREPAHEPEHVPVHEPEQESEQESEHKPEHEAEHEPEHEPEHKPEHEIPEFNDQVSVVKPEDVIQVIQKDSKESEESKGPSELKPEESKERYDEDVPVIVQVVDRPKGMSDWFWNWFYNIHFPPLPWHSQGRLRNDRLNDQPIYIVRESDFDLY